MSDDTPAPAPSPLEALARALKRAGEKHGDDRLVAQGEELQRRWVDSGQVQGLVDDEEPRE
jgi:hypothetical protein